MGWEREEVPVRARSCKYCHVLAGRSSKHSWVGWTKGDLWHFIVAQADFLQWDVSGSLKGEPSVSQGKGLLGQWTNLTSESLPFLLFLLLHEIINLCVEIRRHVF